MQKINHYMDSKLTTKDARIELEQQKIVVAFYTNQENGNSVVHSHPYHELIMPVSGSEVVYSIEGGLYQVRLGEVIYIAPETFHTSCFHVTDKRSQRLVIQIDDQIWQTAKKSLTKAKLEEIKQFVILHQDAVFYWDLRALFERMAQSVQLENEYQDTVFIAQTVELQVLLCQILKEKKSVVVGTTNELVTRAVAYLQKHYQEPDLNVTKLAQEMFTSREHLSRVFKQYTMESIHNYLTNLRMQRCRRMLLQGETVAEACMESGFSDYTSFLKAFHHLYGMTPTEYRNTIQK